MIRSYLKKTALICAVAAAAAIAPATASAETVVYSTWTTTGTHQSGYKLFIYGTGNEASDLRISLLGDKAYIDESPNIRFRPGHPCVAESPSRLRCNIAAISYVDIRAFAGNDRVAVEASSPARRVVIYGGLGNDYLDILGTDSKVATLFGEDGDDHVYGRQFYEQLYGGPGNDTLGAGDGNDYLHGGDGTDRADGGAGNDTFDMRDGARDAIGCGAGTDEAAVDAGAAWGSDVFSDCERWGNLW